MRILLSVSHRPVRVRLGRNRREAVARAMRAADGDHQRAHRWFVRIRKRVKICGNGLLIRSVPGGQKGLLHYAERVAPLMKDRAKYANTTERPFMFANWRTGYAWRGKEGR